MKKIKYFLLIGALTFHLSRTTGGFVRFQCGEYEDDSFFGYCTL
jgi:hypothetical protein